MSSHCCPVGPGGGVPKGNPAPLDGTPNPNVVGVDFIDEVVVLSAAFAGCGLPNVLFLDDVAPNVNGVVD